MTRQKLSAIGHRDHDYCNPVAAAKTERLIDLLPLEPNARVLDLGCGRGEFALRIIERFEARVIAVDHSSAMLDAARERAEWTGALGRLHLENADLAQYEADPETFHLTVTIGAGGFAGGMRATCARLRGWTRRGGFVLVGENYWHRKPDADYLAHLGCKEGAYFDHAGNVQAGVDAGLVPMHAVTASVDEWDDYEWRYCRSLERYVREGPDDPDAPAMLEHARRERDAYLRWGRVQLGFGIYLFHNPARRG
jgi:SAM-dependent methyltransferase